MATRIIDKMPAFNLGAKQALNNSLREASRDILVLSKNRAPYQKGALRSQSDALMKALLHWQVNYYMEYARYQEFGGNNKKTIRRYTTSGTGKKYLSSAGNDTSDKMANLFKKHGERVRV